MQTTTKLFVSCFLCLTLSLMSGCGGDVPKLTPVEQMEVDKILSECGRNAIVQYIDGNTWTDDEERVLKYVKHLVAQGADVNATINRLVPGQV